VTEAADAPLLDVRDLVTRFETDGGGELRAVDGVSFAMRAGTTLGVVGESGSGKSVTALSILRLVRDPPGRVVGGQVLFRGRDLLKVGEREMQRVRGAEISMIFQEPMTSLNPVMTTGAQVAEPLIIHRGKSKKEALAEAAELYRLVGIADPERRIHDYPHQMSGGMRQRVMIAMALACRPALVIADEPTTALDVTIQAQILDLIRELQVRLKLAVILVTHDLGVVAQYADDVTILYAARVMEQAHCAELFNNPLNPYTRGLLESIPGADGHRHHRLRAIAGTIPNALHPPSGCRFHPRCPMAIDECARSLPPLEPKAPQHLVACIRV